MEQEPIHQPEDPKKDEDVISDYMEYMQQSDIEFHQSVVKKARNALYLAGVLIFIGEMISMAQAKAGFDLSIFIFAVVEVAIFIALAIWTRWKPYTAVIGGLIAFIGIVVLSMVVNGLIGGIGAALLALISGALMKIFILAALFNALRNAKTLQGIQRTGV